MANTKFINNLYTKCKMHGSGDAQIIISDDELYALICISINDLNWSFTELKIEEEKTPNKMYYDIPLNWFEELSIKDMDSELITGALSICFNKDNDFALFIENISALHRRRVKYKRILSTQPMPTMDQVGPRVLLEYGGCDTTLLANWMLWRKWIYDIDNRSAQETGYLFEPLLASCLGGEPVGAKNSPVKRLDAEGKPKSSGRQIDCLVPSNNTTYELKLRVTIAASGQGRFAEELSFPTESQAAGYKPVLLVLDPTPSDKLIELSKKFISCNGEAYIGEDAWNHMEEEAGKIVAVFIDKYIKPAIKDIEEVKTPVLESINLEWSKNSIKVSSTDKEYILDRI